MKKAAKKQPRLDHIAQGLRPLAVAVKTLEADGRNVRRHSQRNREAITASLKRFGQQAPVVYVLQGKRKVVIKGNGLLEAAKGLGWNCVAAVRSDLAGNDATAFAIADNRTSDLSDFDEQLLAAQLQELEESEYDIEAAGFTDEELQALIDGIEEPPGRRLAGDDDDGPVDRKRGERTAVVIVGHLKFELPRVDFDKWIETIEAKVGNDPDRLVAEIKRRLKLAAAPKVR